MVVIVILGVLAALVVPRVLDRPDEARTVAARADLATIVSALKLYRLDNQRYPTTEQGLGALVAKPESPPVPPNWKPGGYLERLPKDPWGRAYQYANPGLKSEVDVYSFGADGQPGGTGIDADIGSWDLCTRHGRTAPAGARAASRWSRSWWCWRSSRSRAASPPSS